MILERIRQSLSRLSARQRMVAQYILTDYDKAAFMTAEKLAEASDVSQATVVRFANHMGYQRYSELQQDLQNVLQSRLSQTDRLLRTGDLKHHSTMMQTVIRSMHTDIRSIEQTLASIQERDLKRAVEWISNARQVFVAGTHSEYGIACYFASTLCWIRENVFLLDATHNPSFDMLGTASENDVLVAISFPPYPAATVRFLDAAISRGARGIAITNSPLSPLAVRASVSLYTHDEKLFFADNSAPSVSLLSVILALVSSQDFKSSFARLRKKQDYWREIGLYYQEETLKEPPESL